MSQSGKVKMSWWTNCPKTGEVLILGNNVTFESKELALKYRSSCFSELHACSIRRVSDGKLILTLERGCNENEEELLAIG